MNVSTLTDKERIMLSVLQTVRLWCADDIDVYEHSTPPLNVLTERVAIIEKALSPYEGAT